VAQQRPGYWIKNPEVGKRTAVEFLAYQYKDEAQYTHTGNSWFHLHHQEESTEDAYMTRLSDQIDNDNDFGLGHWSETDTQYSDVRHMMHAPLTTPAPLSIAATAPMDTSGVEYIGATMSAPAPPVDPPSNGGSRALSGVPPPIFNGDRDKSELFLDKFMSYEIGERRQQAVHHPFLKVALCLSYMNGPKIDSWARHRRLWLKAQKRCRRVHDGPVPLGRLRGRLSQGLRRPRCQTHGISKIERTKDARERYRLLRSRVRPPHRRGWLQQVRHRRPAEVQRGLATLTRQGGPDTHHTRTRHSSRLEAESQGTANSLPRSFKNAGLHQKSHGGPTPTQQKWAQKLGLHNYQTPAREPPTLHSAPSIPPLARVTTGATRSSPWMWTQAQWTIVETSKKNRPTIPDTWLKIWDGGD